MTELLQETNDWCVVAIHRATERISQHITRSRREEVLPKSRSSGAGARGGRRHCQGSVNQEGVGCRGSVFVL